MCLSIALRRPEAVLATGEHAGHEWQVVANRRLGFRCGYVKVGPGHPWFNKDYNGINCDVHGGLTFAEADTPCPNAGPDDGYWVGFDCGHFGDRADPQLLTNSTSGHLMHGDSIWTQEMVEAECKSLCEQARSAA